MACYIAHDVPADFSNEHGRRHGADAEERHRDRVRSLMAEVAELKTKPAAR